MDGYSDQPFRVAVPLAGLGDELHRVHQRPGRAARPPAPVAANWLTWRRSARSSTRSSTTSRRACWRPPCACRSAARISSTSTWAARCAASRGAAPERACCASRKKSPASSACSAASLKVPVTAKIRLGWDDDSRNYRQIARIVEENGGALIAVHGRTRLQGYSGQADWDAIAEIKHSVSIPVIANGDVSLRGGYRADQGGDRLRWGDDRARRHRQPVDFLPAGSRAGLRGAAASTRCSATWRACSIFTGRSAAWCSFASTPAATWSARPGQRPAPAPADRQPTGRISANPGKS